MSRRRHADEVDVKFDGGVHNRLHDVAGSQDDRRQRARRRGTQRRRPLADVKEIHGDVRAGHKSTELPNGFDYAARPRRVAALACALLAASPAATLAQGTQGSATFPVGIRELDYIDPHEGGRHLTLRVFYPAAIRERSATPFAMPFFTKLDLYKDAEPAFGGSKHPLVMFSHGRGSNGLYYAWFAEFLAARGYIVAALNHYRANTYDSTIAYLANKLWQRPRDVGLSISFLLNDPFWGTSIDADRIGVAGHSQGGFTALWVGGASINPEKYLAFQRGWRNNQMVPQYLRNELPLDAAPALDVHDKRVKAVFAMAPGIVQAFGMDEAG